MTPNEFQQRCLRTEVTPDFIAEGFSSTLSNKQLARVIHAMIGMETEVGEFQDQIKKHLIYRKPLDVVNLMEEALDVMWYVSLALDACGYTMEDGMERLLQKLLKRYPDKFTEEAALKRDLDAERAALEGK